ncbi:ly6/PLAUR domain-containing protein 8-like [Scyliorhinus canicula]|uniref:ly6/PLAUR domain-containing protein 8-like n=1 Tax=Scyliorhinus canicula TaxID=7830 RepID=UPI0018F54D2F|nr:ly6/PLAUR domain-containing protein 8-like [Scyliorhinus canicula]
MMKLFSGIFIICALVTEGNYSQRMVCKPAENLICITIEITTGDVQENTTLNGVECYTCHGDSAAACTNNASIVKCVGIQNRCAYTYTQLSFSGQHAFVKGCLSESTCQSPKTSFFGVQNSSDIQCCQGNLCNKETTLPGQQCHSCFGESGVCSSKPIQCISSSCTTASIKEVINGTSQEYLLKGCGNCFGSLSFNAGPFSVERADRCCQSDNCNNQTVAGFVVEDTKMLDEELSGSDWETEMDVSPSSMYLCRLLWHATLSLPDSHHVNAALQSILRLLTQHGLCLNAIRERNGQKVQHDFR